MTEQQELARDRGTKARRRSPRLEGAFPLLHLPANVKVRVVHNLFYTEGLLRLAEAGSALHELLREQTPKHALQVRAARIKRAEDEAGAADDADAKVARSGAKWPSARGCDAFLRAFLPRINILHPPINLARLLMTEVDGESLLEDALYGDGVDLLIPHGKHRDAASVIEALALLEPSVIECAQEFARMEDPPKDEDLDYRFAFPVGRVTDKLDLSKQVAFVQELIATAARAEYTGREELASKVPAFDRALAMAVYSQWGPRLTGGDLDLWVWDLGKGTCPVLEYDWCAGDCDVCTFDVKPLAEAVGIITRYSQLRRAKAFIEAVIGSWATSKQLIFFAYLSHHDERMTPEVVLPMVKMSSLDSLVDGVRRLSELAPNWTEDVDNEDPDPPWLSSSLSDSQAVMRWIELGKSDAQLQKQNRALANHFKKRKPFCSGGCDCPVCRRGRTDAVAERLIENRLGAMLLCMSTFNRTAIADDRSLVSALADVVLES